ncbi:YqaA family protein [Xinfangfangia sp. CPCC 101601]|uniref:YqaA family protein n=1 Tax=Pseudogemmobacter lacusdianii TaxID=3069608 RepID=A0ABU0VXF3_9RHOB|nr:YqaA family protein [Xinfangfangia sp. CPCC 101601]MDQ2066432.1 YqaA family protein [Xinfangfangia sp. CPCC 101601]
MTALAGLFLAAFLAATPLPLPSEPVFLAMLTGGWDPLTLVVIASIGNTLGSGVTYALGRYAEHFRHHKWFPLPPDALAKAQGWWQRWGLWTLLLSWAPGGDALVALAGLMRVPLWKFLALTALAKTARYAVLAGAVATLF